jgi:trimeric autotransporter adhesin
MISKKYIAMMCSLFFSTILFSQNVGIGTTSPIDKLTVQTTSGAYGITHTDGTVRLSSFVGSFFGGAWFGTPTNHGLNFYTSNIARVNILANGNVGIGLSNPVYKLEVANRMRLHSQGSDGVTAGIFFNNYNNTAEEGFIGEVGPGAPNHLGIFGSVSGWHFVMNTVSGNVGINTFNTGAGNGKLNIASPGNAIKLIGGGQYISFYDAGNNYKGYIWNPGNNIEIGTELTNGNGEVNLKTKGVQGLSVQSDGRIRVGDIACTIPIDIWGPVNPRPILSVLGHIGIKKDFGDRIGEWAISYSGTNTDDGLAFHYNGGNKAWIDASDGGWTTPSDMRLKEDFEEYKPVLEGIKNITVCLYHYKSNKPGVRSFGLIAQNVQQYFPEIVSASNGPGNLLGIDYTKTGVLAIKAIQEQQQIIESQQEKISELEKRLERLERKRH